MNKKTRELCEIIKNADPFKDEFWNEVLSDQVNEFVNNFSKKDWIDVVSILPLGNREKDYCLLEVICNNSTNEIFALTIGKMIELICQDYDFLDFVIDEKVSRLNLSKDILEKLKNACSERIRNIKANIRGLDFKLKKFETFMKNS